MGCSGDKEPSLLPRPLSSPSWVLRWVGEPPLRCSCLTGLHLVHVCCSLFLGSAGFPPQATPAAKLKEASYKRISSLETGC